MPFCAARFGRAFIYDAGTSVGEISGHSKTINSVDIKPVRPYRAITVSDDLGSVAAPPAAPTALYALGRAC